MCGDSRTKSYSPRAIRRVFSLPSDRFCIPRRVGGAAGQGPGCQSQREPQAAFGTFDQLLAGIQAGELQTLDVIRGEQELRLVTDENPKSWRPCLFWIGSLSRHARVPASVAGSGSPPNLSIRRHSGGRASSYWAGWLSSRQRSSLKQPRGFPGRRSGDRKRSVTVSRPLGITHSRMRVGVGGCAGASLGKPWLSAWSSCTGHLCRALRSRLATGE